MCVCACVCVCVTYLSNNGDLQQLSGIQPTKLWEYTAISYRDWIGRSWGLTTRCTAELPVQQLKLYVWSWLYLHIDVYCYGCKFSCHQLICVPGRPIAGSSFLVAAKSLRFFGVLRRCDELRTTPAPLRNRQAHRGSNTWGNHQNPSAFCFFCGLGSANGWSSFSVAGIHLRLAALTPAGRTPGACCRNLPAPAWLSSTAPGQLEPRPGCTMEANIKCKLHLFNSEAGNLQRHQFQKITVRARKNKREIWHTVN